MIFMQISQAAQNSGTQTIDWIEALAPIIGATIAIIGVGFTAFFTIRKVLVEKKA